MALSFLLLCAAPGARAETIVLRPGPEGIDTAPYQFTPALVRGDRETLYAFTDPDGVHSFETFVRFELPPDLVGPDEEIAEARLVLHYGFDFDVYGDTSHITGSMECREVLESWTENITWTQRPVYGAPVDVVEGIAEFGPIACDVTELVVDWVSGVRPNHGVAVTNPTFRVIGFFSSDVQPTAELPESVRPALEIDVVPAPEPAAGAGALAALLALRALRRRRTEIRP
ncbi:MAG TPA: DNRLRE domain-containing protein [Myxococcota bacterium]